MTREEVARRVAAEQKLNERLQIALGKHGFMACSQWEGKERIEKTVWDALISSEMRVDELGSFCQVCGHEWSRHDPEDGRCDAGPPCGCGRNLEGMQARIAQLSKAALAGMPAPKPEPVGVLRIQDAAAENPKEIRRAVLSAKEKVDESK